MAKKILLASVLFVGTISGLTWMVAQEDKPDTIFHVNVNMVQLDVAVTDKKGDYITGLSPWDFTVFEDGITERIATFGEENEAPRALEDYPRPNSPSVGSDRPSKVTKQSRDNSLNPVMRNETPERIASMVVGASVFVLFDTSNYMYRGFVFAQDAIAEFVRSLDHPYRVAFYSYSRNFSRICMLTPDRTVALDGVRQTVAGDDAALYDALLMTLKDAAQFTGRRVVVVFSNGPDNASMVAPEDVRELAQTEGIPIYMISTQMARLDPVSTAVFGRMSASTGGKSYFARDWQDQAKAFAAIRDDLAHLYTLTYYPQPNANYGWRSINVKLVGPAYKDYHVRTRSGYRPRTSRHFVQTSATP
ncbi:MAG TPA: VWA domain-containing protein [Terriglobia bacterium]|nr:VWA domain-containing protein [Terriglobia bacterium]